MTKLPDSDPEYTTDVWAAAVANLSQREAPSACPCCERTGFFGPRCANRTRLYRACKFCGFWQDVGKRASRHHATVHGCLQWPDVAAAPYIWWVPKEEETYPCPYCAEKVMVEEARVIAPVEDEAHPWWQVPQGMDFDESGRFWRSQGQDDVYL